MPGKKSLLVGYTRKVGGYIREVGGYTRRGRYIGVYQIGVGRREYTGNIPGIPTFQKVNPLVLPSSGGH